MRKLIGVDNAVAILYNLRMVKLQSPDKVDTVTRASSQKRQVVIKTVSLYPSDIAMAEDIQAHYGFDSFAQAIRRAIRMTADHVEVERRRVS